MEHFLKSNVYITVSFKGLNLGAVTFPIKSYALKCKGPLQIFWKK